MKTCKTCGVDKIEDAFRPNAASCRRCGYIAKGHTSWSDRRLALGDLTRHKTSQVLKNRYGITLDDYERMLSEQDNHCALCPTTEAEHGCRLHVDHNHTTNEVRGLLCVRCNTRLAVLEDSSFVEAAWQYLLKEAA